MQGNLQDFPIAKYKMILYNVTAELERRYTQCNRIPSSTFIIKGKEVSDMLFAPKEKGQGLVEYALILVLVAIVVIAILLLLGPVIGNVFSTIVNAL
jgi:pilus assembly protein Flp/PilA